MEEERARVPTNEEAIEAILGDWDTQDPTRLTYRLMVKHRLLDLANEVEKLQQEQETGEYDEEGEHLLRLRGGSAG